MQSHSNISMLKGSETVRRRRESRCNCKIYGEEQQSQFAAFLLHRYLPADKLRGSGQSPELILGCESVLKINHELSISQPPVANRHGPLL